LTKFDFLLSMNNYLIYLIYGNSDYYNELYYSILSFYKFHSNNSISVIIYTDNEAFIKKRFPKEIIVKTIDKETLTQWIGTTNYIYRTKVKVLQDVHHNYTGNFLFVDTDTYFKQNIAELFAIIAQNGVVMDVCEGKLIDNNGGIARKVKRFLNKQNQFSLSSDTEIVSINHHFTVWNSGVIGFNTNFSKLQQVEELVDVFYTKSKIFIAEQIGFNYYLQQYKTPFSAEHFIHHYWYFKEFRGVLKYFFNHFDGKSFEELQNEIEKIDPKRLAHDKMEYKKLSFFSKQWRKITQGKKWKIADYKL
jgi:hypothetical protein